jgi:hypothetical protein
MKNWIHLLLQEVTKSLTTSSTVNISGTTKISLASSFGIAPMLNGVLLGQTREQSLSSYKMEFKSREMPTCVPTILLKINAFQVIESKQ